VAIIIGTQEDSTLREISERVDRVVSVGGEELKHFNADIYKQVLSELMEEHRPYLTLIGHTPWGMERAPALAVKKGLPIATDCVDILIEDGRPRAIRQIYSGKLFSRVAPKDSESYIFTIRAGAFPPDMGEKRSGEILKKDAPATLPPARKQFVAFEEAGAGEVDISQAELLVSIGRGVGEEEKVAVVKELAERLGGVLSCSRPVVDKGWLPKYHQVGTSGKTVKPKVYLALGISGAFQHIAGISGSGTVIAVNKDKKAPIFRVAQYGVVDDLFKVVEALKEKLAS
ncbi:MAG: electron transfer flavoprotein subunit alpha/FixB family protein, partial [Deltaproteobacteria bacterium]|nr:electron transfer flavoprotein subunit alpha/FixB family protein [Deltaproteobacteria bacterium]